MYFELHNLQYEKRIPDYKSEMQKKKKKRILNY